MKIDTKDPAQVEALIGDLETAGASCYSKQNFPDAAKMFEYGAQVCEFFYRADRFPNGHLRVAAMHLNFGLSLWRMGRLQDAEPSLRKSLRMREALYPAKEYPSGHFEICRGLDGLSSVLIDLGKHSEALNLLLRLTAMLDSPVSVNDPRKKAASWHRLGLAHLLSGQPTEAEAACRRAILEGERIPGGDREGTVAMLDTLGQILVKAGKLAQAQQVYDSLDTLAASPGLDSEAGKLQLATLHGNRGNLYMRIRDFAKAVESYRKSLFIHETVAAALNWLWSSREMAGCHSNLAFALKEENRLIDSEKHFLESLRILDSNPDLQDHPDLEAVLLGLSGICKAKRDYDAAQKYTQRALEINKRREST